MEESLDVHFQVPRSTFHIFHILIKMLIVLVTYSSVQTYLSWQMHQTTVPFATPLDLLPIPTMAKIYANLSRANGFLSTEIESLGLFQSANLVDNLCARER